LVAPPCDPSYSGAEIKRITIQSQPRQIVPKTLSRKKKKSQEKTGGVVYSVSFEFKPQYCRRKEGKNCVKSIDGRHCALQELHTAGTVSCMQDIQLASCSFCRNMYSKHLP
jgi:hypothetical protein